MSWTDLDSLLRQSWVFVRIHPVIYPVASERPLLMRFKPLGHDPFSFALPAEAVKVNGILRSHPCYAVIAPLEMGRRGRRGDTAETGGFGWGRGMGRRRGPRRLGRRAGAAHRGPHQNARPGYTPPSPLPPSPSWTRPP